MTVVSLSLRDGFFVVGCVAGLLVEWNCGSEMPVQEQASNLMYILAWAIFLTAFSLVPFDCRYFVGATFSFKCAMLSIMYQLCMTLLGILVVLKFGRENWSSAIEWLSAGQGPLMSLERQIHYSCIACLIKDFWMPDDLDVSFILHHVVGVIGCGMCLVLPVGFGAGTLNACQAELASMLFNAMFVLPVAVGGGSKFFRKTIQWCYMVGMTLSHIIGVYVFVLFAFQLPPSSRSEPWWTWWRVMYVTFSVLLITFRVGGQVVYAPKILFSDWKPGLLAHDQTNGKKLE